MTGEKPVYKKILLKLSGEALLGEKEFGISLQEAKRIATEIKEVHELGVQVAIVLGGGNIFRGLSADAADMDRASADYMGMLATVINSLALQDALEKVGIYTRVLSAIHMQAVAEPYIRRRATRHLEKGRVIILAAGTGNPYFSTDTAAALRAMELGVDVLMKATRVDGVYDADPLKTPTAIMFKELTYIEVLQRRLKVLDSAATSLCMDNNMPLIVFNVTKQGNIKQSVLGKCPGTIVRELKNP